MGEDVPDTSSEDESIDVEVSVSVNSVLGSKLVQSFVWLILGRANV